jgi:hypothetical protein
MAFVRWVWFHAKARIEWTGVPGVFMRNIGDIISGYLLVLRPFHR